MKNWKRKTAALLLMMLLLTGCGAEKETAPEDETAPQEETQAPEETAPQGNESTLWLPEGTALQMAETEHLPELAALIAETCGIPEEEWGGTRYYYTYVDLNDDGTQEILAVAMGMYTSGSGGDSALLVQPAAGMSLTQKFTLVRMPILISDQTTGGAHDLILLRGGGGSEPAFVRLTCTDGIYSNPADAEVLESLEGITGKAVLCNDVVAELDSGTALTLAGPRQ